MPGLRPALRGPRADPVQGEVGLRPMLVDALRRDRYRFDMSPVDMSPVGNKIRHLLERSKRAQKERDCAGAYYALIQATRAYGHAIGVGALNYVEAPFLSNELKARVDDVFDGCIGE